MQGQWNSTFLILREEVKYDLEFIACDLIWVSPLQLPFVLFLLNFRIPTPFWDHVLPLP